MTDTEAPTFTPPFTAEELIMASAAIHLLGHFLKEGSASHEVCLSARRKMGETLPEDNPEALLAANIRESIAQLVQEFFSCSYCERIRQNDSSVQTLLRVNSELSIMKEMEMGHLEVHSISLDDLLGGNEHVFDEGGNPIV